MTDRGTTEPFETRFAGQIRAYTDGAAARGIDAVAVSRSAMASAGNAAGPWLGRVGIDSRGRAIVDGRWAAASLAVVLVGVVAMAFLGRASDSGIVPLPTSSASSTPSHEASTAPNADVLRHLWQRPLPVAPGPAWGTAFLAVIDGSLGIGPELGAAESSSAFVAAGDDAIVVTATGETSGCAVGDVGTYRWLIEGKDTFLTMTAIGTDACATREAALAGPWVRADLPPRVGSGDLSPDHTLSPGTYTTSGFDPLGDPALSGRLSFTVPEGWTVVEDQPTAFALHHHPDASQGPAPTDAFVFVLTQPRMAAEGKEGAICGETSDAPAVGRGVDEIVAAIVARPGVEATPPQSLTIDGHDGKMLDLRLASSWTGGCWAPGGQVAGVPILRGQGAEMAPSLALGPDVPVRVILLELPDKRTVAIATFRSEPSLGAMFHEQLAEVMPIIESFEFHPAR